MQTFRRARLVETQTVVDLLHARVAWLRDRGLDQWGYRDPARRVSTSVIIGEVWVLVLDGRVVGTSTMTTLAPADFWTDAERAGPALYLSKMATWPDSAGSGLGTVLLDSAARYAAARGIARLRWDAWKTNPGLHRYYTEQGATHVRTVELSESRNSGALFERDARMPADEDTVIDAPIEHTRTLNTTIAPVLPGLATGRGSHEVVSRPEHWHNASELLYANLGAADEGPPTAARFSSDERDRGPILYHAGDRWRAAAAYAQPATGPALRDLHPGRPYRLHHVSNGPSGCGVAIFGDAVDIHARR